MNEGAAEGGKVRGVSGQSEPVDKNEHLGLFSEQDGFEKRTGSDIVSRSHFSFFIEKGKV